MSFESAAEAYYSNPEVVRILREYIGFDRYGGPARYIAGSGKYLIENGWTFPVTVQRPSGFNEILEKKLDI